MHIVIIALGAFIIAIFSTLSGGGASLLLMPLITYAIGVRYVAPIMTIGIAVSSSSRVFYFWKEIDWHLFKWLFPSTIVGSIIGAQLFAIMSSDYLQVIIGLFLVSTVFQFWVGNRTNTNEGKFKIKAWHFMPIGFVISFLSGLIGGVGPLMNSAYLNYGMKKESLIGTRSANAVLLHVSKVISYAFLGFVTPEVIKYGLIIGVSSAVANYIGKLILGKMSDILFKKIVITTMVVSGVLMLWKHREFINELFNKIL